MSEGIEDCPECEGDGGIECDDCNGTGDGLEIDTICDSCGGTGSFECHTCEGAGSIPV